MLDSNNVKFGDLWDSLGAIRENDFIDHDKDIDLMILDEFGYFIDSLNDLISNNFSICRYENNTLSIIIMDKNDEKIAD